MAKPIVFSLLYERVAETRTSEELQLFTAPMGCNWPHGNDSREVDSLLYSQVAQSLSDLIVCIVVSTGFQMYVVSTGFQSHSTFTLALLLHSLDTTEVLSCTDSVLFFPCFG